MLKQEHQRPLPIQAFNSVLRRNWPCEQCGICLGKMVAERCLELKRGDALDYIELPFDGKFTRRCFRCTLLNELTREVQAKLLANPKK